MARLPKAKGPAEVAASPSHGSNNPQEGRAVNRQHDTTTPVAPAMPDFRAAFMDLESSIGQAIQMIEIGGAVIEDIAFDSHNTDTVVETILLNRLVFTVYQTEKMLKEAKADWDRAYDASRGAA